jgi:RNA polymerase sigma factor (TIGR02999 family)
MDADRPGHITRLLAEVQRGDATANAELAELVYDELRRIARRHLRRERPNHTLQPTALVHEAYLLLVGQHGRDWQNRSHFFAVAAQIMRRVLVDYARASKAMKRGGGQIRSEHFDIDIPSQAIKVDEVLLVDDSLKRLEHFDSRQCRVVELRYFAGMTEEEVAEVLGVSERTVKRDWNMARSFLRADMDNPSKDKSHT